jgi:hypothetical protein
MIYRSVPQEKAYEYAQRNDGKHGPSVMMFSMSKEMVQVGNQLYVSFESGAKKYRKSGKRQTYHLYDGNIKSLVK